MTKLPSWEKIINLKLGKLENYLIWAALELRRIAINNDKQQVSRIALSSSELKLSEGDEWNTDLKIEINLEYDSEIVLLSGLNFVKGIKNISEDLIILPQYSCYESNSPEINQALLTISQENSGINSFEKFVYWLCVSWQLSINTQISGKLYGGFSFIEENKTGAAIKFSFSIPCNYDIALKKNIVCSANPLDRLIGYDFPDLIDFLDPPEQNTAKLTIGNLGEMNNFTLMEN